MHVAGDLEELQKAPFPVTFIALLFLILFTKSLPCKQIFGFHKQKH